MTSSQSLPEPPDKKKRASWIATMSNPVSIHPPPTDSSCPYWNYVMNPRISLVEATSEMKRANTAHKSYLRREKKRAAASISDDDSKKSREGGGKATKVARPVNAKIAGGKKDNNTKQRPSKQQRDLQVKNDSLFVDALVREENSSQTKNVTVAAKILLQCRTGNPGREPPGIHTSDDSDDDGVACEYWRHQANVCPFCTPELIAWDEAFRKSNKMPPTADPDRFNILMHSFGRVCLTVQEKSELKKLIYGRMSPLEKRSVNQVTNDRVDNIGHEKELHLEDQSGVNSELVACYIVLHMKQWGIALHSPGYSAQTTYLLQLLKNVQAFIDVVKHRPGFNAMSNGRYTSGRGGARPVTRTRAILRGLASICCAITLTGPDSTKNGCAKDANGTLKLVMTESPNHFRTHYAPVVDLFVDYIAHFNTGSTSVPLEVSFTAEGIMSCNHGAFIKNQNESKRVWSNDWVCNNSNGEKDAMKGVMFEYMMGLDKLARGYKGCRDEKQWSLMPSERQLARGRSKQRFWS